LLTINQFDDSGQKIKTVTPILDGSCGSMDDFFDLLKEYLLSINLEEASEIVFCADGGKGIWPRIDNLIDEFMEEKRKMTKSIPTKLQYSLKAA